MYFEAGNSSPIFFLFVFWFNRLLFSSWIFSIINIVTPFEIFKIFLLFILKISDFCIFCWNLAEFVFAFIIFFVNYSVSIMITAKREILIFHLDLLILIIVIIFVSVIILIGILYIHMITFITLFYALELLIIRFRVFEVDYELIRILSLRIIS